MTDPRIEIDLNANGGGFNRARLQDADGPLAEGDVVLAVEPEEAICFDAIVHHVDDTYAYLLIDNDSVRADTPSEEQPVEEIGVWISWARGNSWGYRRQVRPAQTESAVRTYGDTQVLLPTG